MFRRARDFTACCSIAILAGCGGGGGGGGSGALSLAITDAPVDGVEQVIVEFTGVTLKPAGGAAFDVEFDAPVTVDLKALDAGNSELLLDGEIVPAGRYEWLRLAVNAEFDDRFDSYVVEDGGGQVELRVPSGANSGLKLVSGFTVVAGGESSFVIDWNLRQGLVKPPGQPGYKLQPALRITDMQEFGSIEGMVDAALVTAESCTSDPNTGEGNAIYLFAGADIAVDDIDGIDPEPLTIADVRLDETSGEQRFRATFLAPGDYTLAFTCQAGDDEVPDDEVPAADVDDPIAFTAGVNATVVADQTVVVDF
jgi:Domain of unknown function (DUF4382)